MKKLLLSIVLLLSMGLSASSQEIYNEVKAIMEKQKEVKFDKKKSLSERKLATFKYDAIYYLLLQGSKSDTFTEYDLGEQTSAMIDYVQELVTQIAKYTKYSQREVVMSKFKKVSLENSLFQDMDKELVLGYVDNKNFITQFSLDTNWVKALEEIHKIYPSQVK